MVTDRKLMQQWLDAIAAIPEDVEGYLPEALTNVVIATRERLAQPVQEPKLSCGVDFADGLLTVSVGRICADGSMELIHCEQIEIPVQEPVAEVKLVVTGGNAGIATRIVEIDDPLRDRLHPGTKLYTAPQPRQWQGLTQEDMPDGDDPVYDDRLFLKGMAWADAKLMKKNGGGV